MQVNTKFTRLNINVGSEILLHYLFPMFESLLLNVLATNMH